MPTYDYVCSVCGHRMEVVHGIHGSGPERCPVCGGPMRKALNVPAVHFRGSGWAKKDRRAAASTKTAAKADGGDAASDNADSRDKSDSSDKTDSGQKTDSGDKGGSRDKPQPSAKTGSSRGDGSAGGETGPRAPARSDSPPSNPSGGHD